MIDSHRSSRIAVVGAGLIGRAWSIVFARAGHDVALHDADADALARSIGALKPALDDLAGAGLLDEAAARVAARIVPAASLASALDEAVYVQESIAENLAAKQTLFADIDRLAAPSAILASSTSGILASHWSAGLAGRSRCLVAHPINPPHLVPLVELAPAPWTSDGVVQRAKALLEAAGQVPIVVRREVQGFVVNRLQGALLAEAFRLYADGYASADDIDKAVRDGLGLRWSFMGPFETIDLNAPGGIADYCARYGPLYQQMDEGRSPRRWDDALVRSIEAERRAQLAEQGLGARSAWRDRRLTKLVAHKRRAASED
jgi:3-hydroxyacyl-CoA dehydrogenase